MGTASKARRFAINLWGIASVIFFVGDYLVSCYSFSLQDSGRAPLFSTTTNYEQAVIANLAALVCGIVAVRRGSNWWLFLVLASTWGLIVNFLGDL
jgi:hypothetical protein